MVLSALARLAGQGKEIGFDSYDIFEDPLDIDDAAYAAGRYLCADHHDLATDSGWSAAVFSYNHDAGYVRSVNEAARSYSQFR